jgi:hypothetical protein
MILDENESFYMNNFTYKYKLGKNLYFLFDSVEIKKETYDA